MQGERLDNIAAQYLGDPTLFWRLADANGAMRPEELTETVGRKLRITMPEGITGIVAMNQWLLPDVDDGRFNAEPRAAGRDRRADRVQVTTTVGSQGGFQLKFTHGQATSPLQQLLNSGFFDPRTPRDHRGHRQRLDRSADGRHHHQAGLHAQQRSRANRC